MAEAKANKKKSDQNQDSLGTLFNVNSKLSIL